MTLLRTASSILNAVSAFCVAIITPSEVAAATGHHVLRSAGGFLLQLVHFADLPHELIAELGGIRIFGPRNARLSPCGIQSVQRVH